MATKATNDHTKQLETDNTLLSRAVQDLALGTTPDGEVEFALAKRPAEHYHARLYRSTSAQDGYVVLEQRIALVENGIPHMQRSVTVRHLDDLPQGAGSDPNWSAAIARLQRDRFDAHAKAAAGEGPSFECGRGCVHAR